MTIKQPSERTGPNGPNKMCGGSLGMFHDYSLPHPAMLDHSLQMDVQACASSPNSLYLYEQDLDVPCSLPSSSDGSHMNDFGQLDELDLKPEVECYDLLNLDMKSIHSTALEDMSSSRDPVWSPSVTGLMKMEDIFQVDHSDAIQGPTLAELNGDQSQSLLDEAENFIGLEELGMGKPCIYPVVDVKPQMTPCSAPCNEPSSIEGLVKSSSFSLFPRADCAKTSCQQTCVQGTPVSPTEDNKGSLQLLLQSQVTPQALGSLGPPRTQPPSATLSRPTNRSKSPGAESTGSDNSMDRKWEEIKQFIHDDPEMFKRKDTPLTTIKVEPEDPAYTPSEQVAESTEDMEEGLSSDSDESNADVLSDDQDHDDDVFSDAESQDSLMSFTEESPVGAVKKGKRYFWQYNTQSKGPKGKRLCKSVDSNDPHVLNDFKDPVFDPDLNQNQYKHNGKARRGDGNDITPSPQKLFQIGNELKKLNRIINDLTPVSELPVNARSRSRKEKNKLASRACRLKKKAQHEANKVKLYGLHQEHEQLLDMLDQICDEVKLHLEKPAGQSGETMTAKLERVVRNYSYTKVAGNSTKFVNSVLVKVAAGDHKGGLNN